jgi:uncharacterized Fe-S cluster protein YjdI
MISGRKGARVKCFYNEAECHGVVEKGGAKKLVVTLDDGECIEGAPRLFDPSEKPFPVEVDDGTLKKVKKGERVCMETGSGQVHGVVIKGGSNTIEMMADGGKQSSRGHVSLFSLSSKSLPYDPQNIMSKWGVSSYKEIPAHGDSRTFTANITLNGKKVISVGNSGWGGQNSYHRSSDGHVSAPVITQFIEETKQWWGDHGGEAAFEIEDLWVDWFQHRRPYGVTSQMYVDEFKTKMAKLNSCSNNSDDQESPQEENEECCAMGM